jgi:glycosyltransferase involved in cell wall biosynthesis
LVFSGRRNAKAYIERADIILQPSRAEAMSRVMLEAMKSGTPLICTDIEGSGEVLTHGVDGILVPTDNPEKVAEALEYLRNNPERRKKMAEAAREKFESDYSWGCYKRRWEAFIKSSL